MVPVGRLNLIADRMRFGAAVGGVAFAVTLILMIQALYAGYRESVQSFVENVPADLWIGQAGAFDLFRSTTIVPKTLEAQVSTRPGIKGIGELRGRQASFDYKDSKVRSLFISFSPGAEEGVSKALGLNALPKPGEIAISDFVHKKSGLSKGDTISINGATLTVVDVLTLKSPPFGTFSVINFDDANRIFSLNDAVSYMLVQANDPANSSALAEDIRNNVPGVSVYTRPEFATSNARTVREFLPVIGVLLVVSYMVGTIITGLTIYTATIEKTRDYGVLKAIGAKNFYVYSIVIYQSMTVSILGFLIGLPLALVASQVAEARVPEFITTFNTTAIAATFGAVILMGLIASLWPVRRITAIDPAIVFRA